MLSWEKSLPLQEKLIALVENSSSKDCVNAYSLKLLGVELWAEN